MGGNIPKFFTKAILFVSLLCGILSFILSWCLASFFLSFPLSILAALTFSVGMTLGLMLLLPVVLLFEYRKYKDIDDIVNDEILLKENVNFNTSYGVRNGFIILSKDRIHFFSRNKKPFLEAHIHRDELLLVQNVENRGLRLYTAPNTYFDISEAPNCEEIVACMTQNGWITDI